MSPRILIPIVVVLGLAAVLVIVTSGIGSGDGAKLANASGRSVGAADSPGADFVGGARGAEDTGGSSPALVSGEDAPRGASASETAQSVESRAPDRRRGGLRGDLPRSFRDTIEQRLLDYDTDGDGALSPDEREAMFRDRIARYDTNGDGLMTIRERVEGRTREFLESPMGDRIKGFFDQDGDGVLSAEEQARFDERAAQRQQRSMDRLLEEHDQDGDGVMSDEETLAMQDDWIEQQRQWFDSVTEQFDADGDEQLNLDERDTAWETAQRERARGRFLRRYDVNGDGRIGDADHERFVGAYDRGDPLADVNRDGVVNMDDLISYRDMTEAVERDTP